VNLLPGLTTSPLEELYVSLDLETTGLDAQRDAIIEVGAVKFRGMEEIETFHALVNPLRALSPFVVELTGISQREVDGASTFSMVAADVAAFLGNLPIVGHNVAFDLAFLAQGGLNLPNARYDTLDLASVFLPGERSYAQSELSRSLGLAPERPHRALEDARTCHWLFVALVERAMERDPGLLAKLADIAGRSPWPLRPVFASVGGRGIAAWPGEAERNRRPGCGYPGPGAAPGLTPGVESSPGASQDRCGESDGALEGGRPSGEGLPRV